jgi:hypothetical protein
VSLCKHLCISVFNNIVHFPYALISNNPCSHTHLSIIKGGETAIRPFSPIENVSATTAVHDVVSNSNWMSTLTRSTQQDLIRSVICP